MMALVRKATIEDLPQYVLLAQEFHAASPMHGAIAFDPEGYANFFTGAVQNPDIGLWLAESDSKVVGITGAINYPLYFSPSSNVVQELWWWLTPDARGTGAGAKMFDCIKVWAKEKNASAMFMIALEDDRAGKMEKLYRRAGFKPLERTFIKEVM
jgi:GNAT superfamily N-acetyltransferase